MALCLSCCADVRPLSSWTLWNSIVAVIGIHCTARCYKTSDTSDFHIHFYCGMANFEYSSGVTVNRRSVSERSGSHIEHMPSRRAEVHLYRAEDDKRQTNSGPSAVRLLQSRRLTQLNRSTPCLSGQQCCLVPAFE